MTTTVRTRKRTPSAPAYRENYGVTVEDVRAFFARHTRTQADRLRLIHRLGVRFNSNGTVRCVIPV